MVFSDTGNLDRPPHEDIIIEVDEAELDFIGQPIHCPFV